VEDGIARAAQPALEGSLPRELGARHLEGTCAVPFAVGGAFLFRRELFLELGGFDPAFEPFYLEDLDLGWRAWKAGFTCLYVGSSVVEHRHRATIGALVPEPVVLAAIERNRLLFHWKHVDDPRLLEEHVGALARRVAEAVVRKDRAFLTALCLALDERGKVVGDERAASEPSAPSFVRIRAASDPFQDD
ncbi:MAG TPA: glycosyltransferase, partial [Planctomycetota bacterium]|nr:glycosyltransferase [Planctomycetota bacterium]